MNKKYLITALIGSAIALNVTPLQAKSDSSRQSDDTIFVCATAQDTPTMFAYTPGKVNLTPLISWHDEYLLPEQSGKGACQQTATKLQASYQQGQKKYLKAEEAETENLVCLVSEEDQNCNTEESEKLFSVNPNYDPGCVIDNKEPIECMALNARGVYSFEDKPYQPLWWPW